MRGTARGCRQSGITLMIDALFLSMRERCPPPDEMTLTLAGVPDRVARAIYGEFERSLPTGDYKPYSPFVALADGAVTWGLRRRS